jgi:hypothetical protein
MMWHCHIGKLETILRVRPNGLQGQSEQDKSVPANLRKIGHELNQWNASFEQGKVVRDPNFAGIELHHSAPCAAG